MNPLSTKVWPRRLDIVNYLKYLSLVLKDWVSLAKWEYLRNERRNKQAYKSRQLASYFLIFKINTVTFVAKRITIIIQRRSLTHRFFLAILSSIFWVICSSRFKPLAYHQGSTLSFQAMYYLINSHV